MEYEEGGEFACCGVFQSRFTDRLTRADEVMSLMGKKLLIRVIKEVGKGARSLLRLHTEINLPSRVKTLSQPSIRSFMVRTVKRGGKLEEEDMNKVIKRTQGKKRISRRSKYVNPESEASEDEAVPIRCPPPPERIFSRHIEVKSRAGQVTYWEWKAG